MSFNLIDEPWLPCETCDGQVLEAGIRQTLIGAHEWGKLRDDSPIITAALYRLLLAILHRVLNGPRSRTEWHQLWRRGKFDPAAIDAYLGRACGCETVRDRFDLFHAEHPFYQVGNMPKEIKPSGIARLASHLRNGGDSTALFNHEAMKQHAEVEVKIAARWLVAQQAAAFSGAIGANRGSYIDAPMTRGAVFLMQGENLFQTLMLNLIEYDADRPIPQAEDDLPAWERSEARMRPIQTKTPLLRIPSGYVDYLTWQSRAFLITPPSSDDRTVSECAVFDGERLDASRLRPDIDPMMAYWRITNDKKQEIKSLRIRSERAIWRDCDVFLGVDPEATQRAWRRPRAMDMVSSLVAEGMLNREAALSMLVLGWDSDQAKVKLWRHESLQLPVAYLSSRELLKDLTSSLAVAVDVDRALGFAVRTAVKKVLSPGEAAKADKVRVSQMFEELAPLRRYWSHLETPFRGLMFDLPGDGTSTSDDESFACRRTWLIRHWFQNVLKRIALAAYRDTAGSMGASSRSLRAVVEGERQLMGKLKHIERDRDLAWETVNEEVENVETG